MSSQNQNSGNLIAAEIRKQSGNDPFVEYYKVQSITPGAIESFRRVKDLVMRVRQKAGSATSHLAVADIGCNTGTQMIIWGEEGHDIFGLEINEGLLEVARERCAAADLSASLSLGSAASMPWADCSMDVCLMPELLEHVIDWRTCLREAARILRPDGILYLSTTNKLCPRQMEFDLPLYSWYPRSIKRYFEQIAVTSRPELVNHATYPAVNWFTPYGLIRELGELRVDAYDHLDFVDPDEKSRIGRKLLRVVQKVSIVRFFAHTVTPYSMILGIKR